MIQVAIVGTVGLPARYGGFETLVENITKHGASQGVVYTVFCSAKVYAKRLESYQGAKLKYVNLQANGVQSILYDALSMLKAVRGYDVILVLGVSGGVFLPLLKMLSRSRIVVNIDGMEWRRDKWGRAARWFLHLSERVAVKSADVVIADNKGIVDYVEQEYHCPSRLITYGGDHVVRRVSDERAGEILEKYSLQGRNYAMSICRIEPENSCEMILRAVAKCGLRMVFIGNWSKSDYGMRLKSEYSQYGNISCMDAAYDLEELYVLRTGCSYYLHGHTAGGTNPSLVEAMFCGCNIIAYDVVYNRESTENVAHYFGCEDELISHLGHKSNSAEMLQIAPRRYMWSTIAQQYLDCFVV